MGIKDLFSRTPSADELTGSFGEALVGFYSKHFTDALVLHDVIIDGAEGYTSYEKGYEDARRVVPTCSTRQNGRRYSISSPNTVFHPLKPIANTRSRDGDNYGRSVSCRICV